MVQVDPQLLFQRLVTAGKRCGELPLLFMYELCSYPPALFESSGMLRTAPKSFMADAMWKHTEETTVPTGYVQYVLDGGSLLHRVPWPPETTYSSICDMYVAYVGKYGSTIVVFDGYQDGPSTKDNTHQRRYKKQSPLINFNLNMKLKIKRMISSATKPTNIASFAC